MEFNSTIERKIYPEILLYATRNSTSFTFDLEIFLRLQIRSEFHGGSRVGREI